MIRANAQNVARILALEKQKHFDKMKKLSERLDLFKTEIKTSSIRLGT